MGAEFFLTGMSEKCEEGGGRTLLADNTGVEVMPWPTTFQCDGV
jgi:hypothetical protein